MSRHAFYARFVYTFKLWSCFLVFIFLPLDLTYRLDSFLLSWTYGDVVINTAGMILLFLALAVIIAVIATPCSLLLSLLRKTVTGGGSPGSSPSPIAYVTPHILLFLMCELFAKLFKLWVTKFHYEITIKAAFIALLLTVVIYWRNRQGFQQKTELLVVRVWRIVPALVTCCIVLVGWRVATEGIKNHREALKIEQISKQNAASAKGKPNIILITFDALSAEDMSLYGYRLKTTPNIDKFAKQCYVFENCIAASNWTRPSVASLLTGKYPNKHRLINVGASNVKYRAPHESLPYLLKTSGYRNYAFTSNKKYAHPYTLNLDNYFDYKPLDYYKFSNNAVFGRLINFSYSPRYNQYGINILGWLNDIVEKLVNEYFFKYKLILESKISSKIPVLAHHSKIVEKTFAPSKLVFDDGIRMIQKNKNSGGNFYWLHIYQPHSPYISDTEFSGTFLKTDEFLTSKSQLPVVAEKYYQSEEQQTIDKLRLRYDESILYADHYFGLFMKTLSYLDSYNNSIVIISADHGESFRENYVGHGGKTLNKYVMHIPLLIHLPNQNSSQTMRTPVSQVDIMPTILNLIGCSRPGWADGYDLLRDEAVVSRHNRILYSMNFEGNRASADIEAGTIAAIVNNGQYSVYDINGREPLPTEIHNLLLSPQK